MLSASRAHYYVPTRKHNSVLFLCFSPPTHRVAQWLNTDAQTHT
jgi:hypothetical protein